MGTIKIVLVFVVAVVVKPVQSNPVILDTEGAIEGAIENVHIDEVSIISTSNLEEMSRQTLEKLQCLYENPMLNDFRKTAVLEKISIL